VIAASQGQRLKLEALLRLSKAMNGSARAPAPNGAGRAEVCTGLCTGLSAPDRTSAHQSGPKRPLL
jgi:hypothetical protein